MNSNWTKEKRDKWNKYQLDRYYESDKYLAIQIRKQARERHKERIRLEIKQRKLEVKRRRTYTCLFCKERFYDHHHKKYRKYCSRECRANADRIYPNKREARKAYRLRHPGNSKGIKIKAFRELCAKYDYRCAICGKQEPFLNQYWIYLTQDHIIPRSKGGRKRSITNIQPLCWDCNIKKSNKV